MRSRSVGGTRSSGVRGGVGRSDHAGQLFHTPRTAKVVLDDDAEQSSGGASSGRISPDALYTTASDRVRHADAVGAGGFEQIRLDRDTGAEYGERGELANNRLHLPARIVAVSDGVVRRKTVGGGAENDARAD